MGFKLPSRQLLAAVHICNLAIATSGGPSWSFVCHSLLRAPPFGSVLQREVSVSLQSRVPEHEECAGEGLVDLFMSRTGGKRPLFENVFVRSIDVNASQRECFEVAASVELYPRWATVQKDPISPA